MEQWSPGFAMTYINQFPKLYCEKNSPCTTLDSAIMKRSPAMSGGVKRSVPSRSPASTTPDDFSDSSKRFRADSNQGASSGASLGGRSGCGKAGCGLLGGGARSAREGRTYGGRGGCVVCDMRGGTSWMALVRILLVGVRQHAMHHILSADAPNVLTT